MTNGLDTTRYHVSAIDPESDERVVFEYASFALANGKAAELRMNVYRQVVISALKPPKDDDPAT
jgi:hypothetical protein